MTSIYEKLEHFNEVILKDAAMERNRLLEQAKSEMKKRISIERSKFQNQADEFLKKEISYADNEMNNMISRAVIESRQMLIKTREDILEAVISGVEKELYDFVEKEEYLPYLSNQIGHSCKIAGEGKLTVYVSKKDMERFCLELGDIRKTLPANTLIEETDNCIIGGCRVMNRQKNILVNNTLQDKINGCRERFFEICDLKID